jgi:hypothetical protein
MVSQSDENHSQKVTWHEIHLGQQGRSQWGHKKLSERVKFPLSQTNMPLPGQNRIHTCPSPPFMIVGIDTVASDDGGHRGMGRGTGAERILR